MIAWHARILRTGLAGGALVLGTACGTTDALSPDGSTDLPALAGQIPLEELADLISTDPARVEAKLLPGELVAREIELESPDDDDELEEIRSEIKAISEAEQHLTLVLGDLRIDFDETTRFRIDHLGDVPMSEFVAYVEAQLGEGVYPQVRARRPAPGDPQAPDDASFFATRLRIRDKVKEPRIHMNIDADNLSENDAAEGPDGWLLVLGLEIEIRQSEGITKIEDEEDDDEDDDDHDREFEGDVTAVDVDAGQFTLENGRVYTLDANSVIEDDGDLLTLQDVFDAVDAGREVEAEGDADADALDDGSFLVLRVKFEDEDHDDDDDHADGEFEGRVVDVDLDNRQFEMSDGTFVNVATDDVIDPDGDLVTLEAVRDAVADGKTVEAEGHADPTDDPNVFDATSVKFELEDDS